MSTADEEVIDVTFVVENVYDSADVTEITITRPVDIVDTGVAAVQIWYKPKGSDTYVPYAPNTSNATTPEAIDVTDDDPIVLVGIDNIKVTDIRIVITKEETSADMVFDIKIHACLHQGKNTV